MADLTISGPIAEHLKRIAEKENKPVEAVLEKMIQRYMPEDTPETEQTTSFKFNSYYEIGSPQATEHGIANLYKAIEEYKRNNNVE